MLILGFAFQYFSQNHQYFTPKISIKYCILGGTGLSAVERRVQHKVHGIVGIAIGALLRDGQQVIHYPPLPHLKLCAQGRWGFFI